LAQADLRGTYSHGVIRLPFLVARVQKGGANPRPALRVVRDDVATVVVDGDRVLGQVTAIHWIRVAIEKKWAAGIGCAVARNSDLIGACAYYPMMALRADMIGVGWTNSYHRLAPWGGRTNRICNDPIAAAVPALRHPPVVLDIAMSVVAGGRVRLAAKKGEKIPLGWVLD
jgi:LDH2 family malate/lactate/ureidoglycolate dehydrogenase